MGILFDFFRKKKKGESKEQASYTIVYDNKKQMDILNEEIENFFPKEGSWGSNCFRRSNELYGGNLPCHLRDNDWMAQLLEKKLQTKGLSIPQSIIKEFMDKSDRFNELRHNYELEIIKWQIGFMENDGEGWLMPKGYDEFSLMISPDVVEIFRGGVVRTLTAIGMDEEVVEEGIEKHADLFRERFIRQGFENAFEPVLYHHGSPKPADKSHLENWLKAKRYQYYCNHKQSVDKYGIPHQDMLISAEEIKILNEILSEQNSERKKVIEEWRQKELSGFYNKLNKKTSTVESSDDEDSSEPGNE